MHLCFLTSLELSNFVVTADWLNGDGTRGFVAELYLTNTGEYPLNWQLAFDLDATITNMWNASYTRDNTRYSVTPASWNTRIEPNETLSFGFQGSTTGTLSEPQNVSCGDSEGSTPPGIDPDAFAKRYAEEFAKLNEIERELLAKGRIQWNGYEFSVVPSPFWLPRPVDGLGTLQAQAPFGCYFKPGVDPEKIEDHGTFFRLVSKAGEDTPITSVSASFVLPAGGTITNEVPAKTNMQELFVMITGTGKVGNDNANTGGFDAGLGFQESGWYALTLRQTWAKDIDPEDGGYTTKLYRLRNIDSNGNIIPDDANTEPYTVDMRVDLYDNRIRLTITPTGNTRWVNPSSNQIHWDSPTGPPGSIVLGGDEADGETVNRGHPRQIFFPVQEVPGIQGNGIDNRVAIEINAARDKVSPAAGTIARGIVVYNAKINGQPWDAANPDDPYHDHVLTCPSDYKKAYDLPENQGSTAAENAEDGFKIDINIKEDDIHRCDVNPNAESCSETFSYWAGGPCYYPWGFFGPCPADGSPVVFPTGGAMFFGGQPTLGSNSLSAFAGSEVGCVATLDFTNTGETPINYAVVPRGSIEVSSDNWRGTIATDETARVELYYPHDGADFYPDVEDIGIFSEATNPATLLSIAPIILRGSCSGKPEFNVSPDDPVMQITLDTHLEDTLETDAKVYMFEAQAGQIVNVAWINPSDVDAMAARVLDPQGQEIARVEVPQYAYISGYFETGPMVLEQTGMYRLEVVVAARDPHTYTLGVSHIEPTMVTALPTTLSEELNVLGKKAFYILDPDVLTLPPIQYAFMKFTLSAANEATAKLYYVRSHEDYLNYTQPGVLIADNGGNYRLSDIWGSHYIEVASSTGPVGSFTLELTAPEITPISLHSNVSGSFAGLSHGQYLLYGFDAEAGQMVNVAILVTTRQNSSVGLLDPNGNAARPFPFIDAGINAASNKTQQPEEQPHNYSEWGIAPVNQTGSYTVVLSPREPNDNNFILGVPLIKQPEALSLADIPLDRPGAFSVLGDYHFYQFSTQANDSANVRLTTPTDNLMVTLAVVRKVGNELYYSASGNNDFRNKLAVTFTTDSERTVETGVVTFPTTDDHAIIVYPGNYGSGWLVGLYQYSGVYEGTYEVMIETSQ